MGYKQPALRTGYEYLMPYKVGKLYCATAPEAGSVVSRTDTKLTVKFASGETKSFPLGQTFGRMEGSLYKHEQLSDLQTGSKFTPGAYLTYNSGFFEKDWLDPSRLVMKFNKLATVAFTMSEEVYEDSSAISRSLSEEMQSTYIKERVFVMEFGRHLLQLQPDGQELEPQDVLFTLVDTAGEHANLSDTSIQMLQHISGLAPKAKVRGKIYGYEVKYNGDLSDMSPSLRKLCTRLDKQVAEASEGTNHPVKNNRVSAEYRSGGKNLAPGTLELKVFIETGTVLAVGDKGVFASQMKSVVSSVLSAKITTESGSPVDALFSYRSMMNRIVGSPVLMGTTNRLLRHLSPLVAKAYFG